MEESIEYVVIGLDGGVDVEMWVWCLVLLWNMMFDMWVKVVI